jgi:hypothetical protein
MLTSAAIYKKVARVRVETLNVDDKDIGVLFAVWCFSSYLTHRPWEGP